MEAGNIGNVPPSFYFNIQECKCKNHTVLDTYIHAKLFLLYSNWKTLTSFEKNWEIVP